MRNEENIIIHWYDIGLELLDDGILDLIKDGAKNPEECCTRMFKTWLDRNPDASWNQLIVTLEKINLDVAAESVKSYSMLTYIIYPELILHDVLWLVMHVLKDLCNIKIQTSIHNFSNYVCFVWQDDYNLH